MQIQCPKCKQWFEDEDENGKCDYCGANLNQDASELSEQIDQDVVRIANRKKYFLLRLLWFSLPIAFTIIYFATEAYYNDCVKKYGLISLSLSNSLHAIMNSVPIIFLIWLGITLWHAFGGHKFLKFLPGVSHKKMFPTEHNGN